MSIIFHPVIAQNNGVIALNTGSGAPVDPVECQGLLIDDAGAIYATTTTPPTKYAYGLPFDDDGRLVIEEAAVAYYSQGLPFTANNALAGENNVSSGHYNQGLFISDSGALAVSGLTPAITSNVVVFGYTGTGVIQFYRMDTDPWDFIDLVPDITFTSIVSGLAFNAEANLFAAVGSGGLDGVEVWDTTTYPFTKVYSAAGPTAGARRVAFTPDGSKMVVGCTGNGTRIYDTSNFSTFTDIGTFVISDIAISGDGTYLVLVSATTSPFYRVYDISASPGSPPTLQGALPSPPVVSVSACAFIPGTNKFVCYQDDGADNTRMRVYDLDLNSFLGSVPDSDTGLTFSVAVSPDKSLFATGGSVAPRLQVFDIVDEDDPSTWTERAVNDPPGITSNVRALSFSADSLFLASESTSVTPYARAYTTDSDPLDLVTDFDVVGDDDNEYSVFLTGITLPNLVVPDTWVALDVSAAGANLLSVGTDGGDNFVVAGASGFVSHSGDGGATWSTFTAGATLNWAVAGSPTGVFVIATQSGAYRSTDGGASFSVINPAFWTGNSNFEGVATNGAGQWVLASGTASLYFSDDDGVTWTHSTGGISSPEVVRWTKDLQFFVVAGNGIAHISNDGGETWGSFLSPQGLNTGSLNTNFWDCCACGTTYLVQSNTTGLNAISVDSAATWALKGNWSTEVGPQQQGAIWSDKVSHLVTVSENGYASYSVDQGINWTALPRGLNSGLVGADFNDVVANAAGTWIAVADGGFAAIANPPP